MLDIEYIPSFLTLTKTLSFSETARLLYISQASVSRHIDSMEQALGIKLFSRTTRKVELTEAGVAILDSFIEIQERYEKIQQIAYRLNSSLVSLKLSCPEFWLSTFIEPLIAFLSEHEPSLHVTVESNAPIQGLNLVRNGSCDMSFGIGIPTNLDSSITMQPFMSEKVVATIHKDNHIANRGMITLKELASVPLVLLDDGTKGFHRMNEELLRQFSEQGLEPIEIHYANQVETLGIAIADCKGYCLPPQSLHLHRDYLTTLPFGENGPTLPLSFFFRTDHLNDDLMLFLEAIKQFAKIRKTELRGR